MTQVTPDRSLAQRLDALQHANDIRMRRAQLKRDLKAGREDIMELLLEPPEYIRTAKVFELLLSCPKWGRVKVNKTLGRCQIAPSKTFGGLSPRQRRELAAQIDRARVCTNGRNNAARERLAARMGVAV